MANQWLDLDSTAAMGAVPSATRLDSQGDHPEGDDDDQGDEDQDDLAAVSNAALTTLFERW